MSLEIKVNENFNKVSKNYLFSEIAKRVKKYKSENPDKTVISLGIGDVTRPLSNAVVTAMKKASEEMGNAETFRGYAPEYGYDFLRRAISDYYKKSGVELLPDEIYASDGAKSDVGNIVDILGNNTVLIPDPVYPVYLDSNLLSGNKAEFLYGSMENGFLPLPDKLTGRGYVIYLCSPNNPTGAVYDRKGLKTWVDFARNSGSLIIFDSAYEAFIKGDYPHSIYEIDGAKECAVEVCSFSKTAGFTGVRCAWSVFPDQLKVGEDKLSALWARRQATKFNGIPYVVQRAAEAAFSDEGLKECRESIDYYIENARIIADVLDKKGIRYTGGKCSPYLWLECPDKMGSWEFFDYLLSNAQIVGTPGAGFGKSGEGFFRLTSFGTRENTQIAAKRLENLL